jgi:hypothetical protein
MLMDLTLVYEDLRKKLHEIFGIALKLWRNWFGALDMNVHWMFW